MNKVFKTLPIHHPLKKWATSWQLWLNHNFYKGEI